MAQAKAELRTPRLELFLSRISIAPNGCWLWTGMTCGAGYGVIWLNSRRVHVHRFAYEFYKGTIPDGLQIDHLCRNPACVNPDHLEAVTQQINLLRGNTLVAREAKRTMCPQGHPYDLFNTYIDKQRLRHCRACGREQARRRYHERIS